ncbi:MAG: DNA mismatch repair endonuclease MutL, partial [bacterium]
TTVEVRDLFSSVPARLKFLKSDGTETGRMTTELSQMALARPDLGLELSLNGRAVLELAAAPPDERLRQLWGGSLAGAALPVSHQENGIQVRGWVAPPALSRGQRSGQWLFVNGRVVEHRQLGFHLSQAYGSLLPHGRHAVAALFLEVPTADLDVNVHPAKREVRFTHEAQVLDCLRHGVSAALKAAHLFADVALMDSAGSGGNLGGPVIGSVYGGAVPFGSASWSSERGQTAWEATKSSPTDGGNLLARSADTTRPAHVEASPWNLPLATPSRDDWPVPLAQLHRSYLLCQDSQGLVVVDQHAAHERVLYERHLRAFAQGSLKSQRLLLPQRLQVTSAQAERLEARIEALAELGLELENAGGGLFFVSALPEFMKLAPAASLVLDLLDGSAETQPRSGNPEEDFRREAAASLACRAAIKAGDPMVWEGMQQLMADLAACEIPWCCPHGRPPLVRLSLVELEKYFQRR